jgi:hypothetical protein
MKNNLRFRNAESNQKLIERYDIRFHHCFFEGGGRACGKRAREKGRRG